MMIDRVISAFSPNEEISHLDIRDNSIITFGKRGFSLGFSNTSHVHILYMYKKLVILKVHNAV